ncbi:hypothetical protein RRG08_061055 [Elysia crispata]|uniref:Uncharacterized protein n=1 Tax=Elysia crispata TaxID=231223 RepID=A0AAE1AUZ4_9GAST|nr:hypothetical protein RRG08_061055 [Elysia crispata]
MNGDNNKDREDDYNIGDGGRSSDGKIYDDDEVSDNINVMKTLLLMIDYYNDEFATADDGFNPKYDVDDNIYESVVANSNTDGGSDYEYDDHDCDDYEYNDHDCDDYAKYRRVCLLYSINIPYIF